MSLASNINQKVITNNIIINRSKSYSKHLVEYFLLKLDHLYILSILLTISIFFFMYRTDEKIPQDYLVVLIVLAAIGAVLSAGTGIHHWLKNSSRRKETLNVKQVVTGESDILETWLKRSQFILVSAFLIAVVVICSVKLNSGNLPKSITYGIAIPSTLLFVYTLGVFIYSFYYVSARSYKVGIEEQANQRIRTSKATELK
jgi:hypothetical protein